MLMSTKRSLVMCWFVCWFGISFYHQRVKVHHWRQASEPPVEPTDAAGSDVKE